MVANKNVVWVGNPETSWGLIGVEQTPRAASADDEIVLDDVLRFDSIFNEDVVAHRVVNDVVLDREILNSVDSHCSVISLMNGIALDQRLSHCADNMEMDGVSAQLERLADIKELCVQNSTDTGLVFWVVNHDVRAVLILRGCLRVSLVFYVSRKKTDLCAHLNEVS